MKKKLSCLLLALAAVCEPAAARQCMPAGNVEPQIQGSGAMNGEYYNSVRVVFTNHNAYAVNVVSEIVVPLKDGGTRRIREVMYIPASGSKTVEKKNSSCDMDVQNAYINKFDVTQCD